MPALFQQRPYWPISERGIASSTMFLYFPLCVFCSLRMERFSISESCLLRWVASEYLYSINLKRWKICRVVNYAPAVRRPVGSTNLPSIRKICTYRGELAEFIVIICHKRFFSSYLRHKIGKRTSDSATSALLYSLDFTRNYFVYYDPE